MTTVFLGVPHQAATSLDPPATEASGKQPIWLDDTGRLDRARQQRASTMKAAVARLTGHLLQYRISQAALVIAVNGAALVLGYSILLSRIGIPAPVAALFAVLFASTLSSIAGFAFSAICGAILLHLMDDPVQTVETMMVCSIAIQSFSVAVLWRTIRWRDVFPFLIGGAGGLPVGVLLLLNLGHIGFREAIGGLLTVYALYALLRRPLRIKSENSFIDAWVGFCGGISGGLAGFPGAAVTIWCGMRGWDKARQRATYQPFILIMQFLGLLLIQFMHPPIGRGHAVVLQPLLFVPVALLGTGFGLTIFRRLSDRSFGFFVNGLLLASGIGLVL
jgi:uncharacterized membrane protein YfcA